MSDHEPYYVLGQIVTCTCGEHYLGRESYVAHQRAERICSTDTTTKGAHDDR